MKTRGHLLENNIEKEIKIKLIHLINKYIKITDIDRCHINYDCFGTSNNINISLISKNCLYPENKDIFFEELIDFFKAYKVEIHYIDCGDIMNYIIRIYNPTENIYIQV